MTTSKLFILDANVFIEAKKRYYAFAICPGFWEALLWHHDRGALCSVDRVKAELVDFGDDLSDWITTQVPAVAFHSTNDQAVTDNYAELVRWVMTQQQFTDAAKAEFADAKVADAWLIAFAKTTGSTLVTHETYDDKIRRKVKIPNVCREFNVPYVDPFDMLVDLGAQFTWTPANDD